MTEDFSKNSNNRREGRGLTGWLLFPLSLFPLVALVTYDWRAIEMLHSPASETANWIGALGDRFAYYGYLLLGLGVWTIPVLCVIFGLSRALGGRSRVDLRRLWLIVFVLTLACLAQVAQIHAPGIGYLLERLNISAAGGVVGYLVMTRFLSPLISDFGASVLMTILAFVTLIAAVGLESIGNFFISLAHWATDRGDDFDHADADSTALPAPDDFSGAQQQYLDILNGVTEPPLDPKAAKRAEKERIKAEKERIKAEKAAAKEAEKQELLAARQRIEDERRREAEAIKAAKDAAARSWSSAPAPAPAPTPALAPAAPRPAMPTPAANPTAGQTETSEEKPDKGPYILPSVDLLKPLTPSTADHSDVNDMSLRLINTLKLFKVDAKLSYTVQGPVVTKYAIELEPGTMYSKVTALTDNLMGALHATSLRIEAPIPGEDRVGIEVPNRKPAGISFREVFESPAWKNYKAELPLLFGKDAAGHELVADLASMPHMLVAGATGQGKSVCLNSLICGLLMTRTPEQLKLIMVDPKSVEFTPYCQIPHLLVPVITDNRKVVFSLHWAVSEMEKRLKLFARARVKNIYDFNNRKSFTQTDMFGNDTEVGSDIPRTLPYIVIIIDEAADLIQQCGKEVNPDIQRITQKARAAGIHVILATQRPDAKIITGSIKANIPGRVAFKTASAVDSRTILDDSGAENLIGRGDMLFRGKNGLLTRAQGAWISDDEIANITDFIQQHSNTQFDEKFSKNLSRVKEADISNPFAALDEEENKAAEANGPNQREMVKAAEDADLFTKAIEVIINTKRASTSHFQRKLGIGYNHSARLMETLEEKGVIGPQVGAGPRTILLDSDALVAILNGNNPVPQIAADITAPADGGDVPSEEPASDPL